MILVFLLVTIVNNEQVSDDRMLFKSVYRCQSFANAIELSKESATQRRCIRNQGVTAYCIPRMVPTNTKVFD